MLKRVPALASSDIVVRVARTTMEGARGQADAGREIVQLLNTIRHEVEPRITVFQDLGIINIYHFQFSLPGWNLPLSDMCARMGFPWAAMEKGVASTFAIKSIKGIDHYAVRLL